MSDEIPEFYHYFEQIDFTFALSTKDWTLGGEFKEVTVP